MHRPPRKRRMRKSEHDKERDALIRTNNVLGAERLKSIQEKWSTLDTKRHGPAGDGDLADGILTCLQKCGLSHIEIRAALKCGSGRLTWLRHRKSNEVARTNNEKRSHALSQVDVNLFKAFMRTLDVEDGFPCAHRCPKFYILRNGKATTWKELYGDYCDYIEKEKEKMDEESIEKLKMMTLGTFREYRIWLFPGHCLSWKKEDVCDHCVRLKIVINNPLSTPEDKEKAKKELEVHNDAAVAQRRAIKHFTKQYMSSLNLPPQPVRMPDYVDGALDGEEEEELRSDSTDGVEESLS